MLNSKIFIIISLTLSLCVATDLILPIVSIELGSVGFHRELHYVTHFDYPLAGKDNCEYFIEQKFPSAIYVDINQLEDLVRLQKIKIIYPHHIDVEIPTEKALPFSVIIWGTPKISDNLLLPIHYRYHAPSTKSFVHVDIPAPKLYLKCSYENLSANAKLQNNDTKYCIKGTEFYSQLNNDNLLDSCDYYNINYDLLVKKTLGANIPVGNLNLYEPVFYITIIVSWIGCLCVLSTIQKKMNNITNKLK